MEIEKPMGLTWGENAQREDGKVHVEWHAPCGCAFHPTPFPHVHPCTNGHKRPDLNIVTAAPPSTSAAIRAAAEEIRNYVDGLICAPPMRDFERAEIERILSRYFGKGETESGESMNRVTFGSSATLAAPDNAACPKCGGTKPTCCSCPEQPANKFVQEFTQAAIEAHVGYQHEARWHECGYAKCVERREMIIALYDATPAAPSPDEPLQELENELIQAAIAAHCRADDPDAQDAYHAAASAVIEARYQSVKSAAALRTSVEGESE